MLRSSLYTAGALLICASAYGQELIPNIQQRFQPVTAPIHQIEGKLDLRTGQFTRVRTGVIGNDGQEEVYDNTCPTGGFAGINGTAGTVAGGGTHAESIGDYGAIPTDAYTSDGFCEVGCASDYDITAFEIAWCQSAAPVTGAVIELDFWNTPQSACLPGIGPIGGVRPPAVSTVLSATLGGLPRTNSIGTLSCYVLTLQLITPGFNLSGTSTFTAGSVANPNFAWAFSMPTSTGFGGPILSGDLNFATPCTPCEGTIFEVGGISTNAGTGGGQAAVFFLDSYGGTTGGPAFGGDCFFFGGPSPTGLHLELFATKPCEVSLPSTAFCNGVDGSTAGCPCAPGGASAGCDVPIPAMQGGGLTGGVTLTATAQSFGVMNAATMTSTGYPPASTPGSVLFRNTSLDAGSPVVFGDGIRCVDGAGVVRIGGSGAAGGTATHTFGHGTMAGTGTFFYQAWFRSTPISYCDPTAAFNLGSGATLDW